MQENSINHETVDKSIPFEHFISEPKPGYDTDRDFITSIAWENARAVKLFFHNKVIPTLPSVEKCNWSDQIRRASISITANISEGYGRFHYKESTQYYCISRGSLCEPEDHLISCHDLLYVDDALFESGLQLIEKAKISLNGFINFLFQNQRKHKHATNY